MGAFDDYGSTFCAFPWVHIMTQAHGGMQPCCTSSKEVKDDSDRTFYLWRSELDEAWNGQTYKAMRSQMLSGKEVKGCEWCYNLEKIGKLSYRQTTNMWWANNFQEQLREIVEKSKTAGFAVQSTPMSLDLRLGNLCNSKCRSCSPTSSSQLEQDFINIAKVYPELSTIWAGHYHDDTPEHKPVMQFPKWYENDAFWSRILSYLPSVKSIYITGGEPTMLKGNYRLLEECVNKGYAQNIELMLNTNLTTASFRFFGLLKHFKNVQLNCSIDAYGRRNEYLRPPSKWETIDANINELLALPENVSIAINTVAQYHNVLYLDELLGYVEDLRKKRKTGRLFFEAIILQLKPAWLEMRLLPAEVKQLAKKRIEKSCETSELYRDDDWTRMSLDAVLKSLDEEPPADAERIRLFNKLYTDAFDEMRGMKMNDYFPELDKMLQRRS